MAECVVCGARVPVSGACTHCARPVCPDHRDPAGHGCPGVDGDATAGWFTHPDDPRHGSGGRTRPTDRYTAPGSKTDGDVRRLSEPRDLARGVLVVLFAAAVVAAALAMAGGADRAINDGRVERLIAAGVNDERASRGLDRLAHDRALAAVAENHSRDMAERGYVAHESPDGLGLAERYHRAGIDCPGGENIYALPNGALDVSDRALADRVVREWMRSPGHRETLLKVRFDRQGIGVVIADDGRVLVTQDLC